jgi:hypothetical protein
VREREGVVSRRQAALLRLLGGGADVRRLAAIAWCVVLAGCAYASPQHTSASAPPRQQVLAPSPHDQIEQLSGKITQESNTLGLPPQNGTLSSATPMTSVADPTCHPAKTDTCSDTCGLADSICTDATKICDLAKQLPGDTWAESKCTSAEDSCDAAHKRCCGCQ